MLMAPSVVQASRSGRKARISFVVATRSAKDLRTAILEHVTRAYSVPSSMYERVDGIGEWAFTTGQSMVFTRGNLGAIVTSLENPELSIELAQQVDEIFKDAPVVTAEDLERHLPIIQDVNASKHEVSVGDTVKVVLETHPEWRGRTSPFFHFDINRFEVEFLDGAVIVLEAIEEGKTEVMACAVDKSTLLCGSKSLEIKVLPGERKSDDEEEEEEEDEDEDEDADHLERFDDDSEGA
jgi:hypothetical protein